MQPTSFRPTDIFLQPGEHFVGDATQRLRTMLGSCVAVTLWHPRRQVGAMSHFLLAERGRRAPGDVLDGRYGDESLALMVRGLGRMRVDPRECDAKIFGGGNMFPGRPASALQSIGQRNGEAARRLLQAQGIPVRSEHLYGDGHRQVVFDIASGAVWVRQIAPGHSPPPRS
ncbi:MAG: chemotaxis protein CheD [Xylophilus ampelinus]